MTDYTPQRVNQVVRELLQKDENDMRQSSTVRAAQANLDTALRRLASDRHNSDLQLAAKQAQSDLYKAQDTFHRERRLAAQAEERAAKAALVAQAEARRASEIEQEAFAAREPAFLASGGTHAQFLALWPRMWEEILIARSAAEERRMAASVQFRSEPTPHATAPAVEMVEADESISNYRGR